MTTRRKFLMGSSGALFAVTAPLASLAQQQGKTWRIGFLGPNSQADLATRLDDFRAGLRNLGYAEGRNLTIEYRWAEGRYDRFDELAASLVQSRVDVIVTFGTPGTKAAKAATTTIPIVMVSSGDAVATGLVASLARPGGNITGLAFFSPEISAKRLEMLKEAVPRVTKVAYLFHPDNSVAEANLKVMALRRRH